MFTSITIENFRCFEKLEIQKLGRVNLFVGKNNCGKTSVLEAIRLLCAREYLAPFYEALIARREFIQIKNSVTNGVQTELDVLSFFKGRQGRLNDSFLVKGITNHGEVFKFVAKLEASESNSEENLGFEEESGFVLALSFEMEPSSKRQLRKYKLSPSGGFLTNYNPIPAFGAPHKQLVATTEMRNLYVPSSMFDREKLISLFDSLAQVSEERVITDALKVIDEKIERINVNSTMQDFKLLLSGSDYLIPLGSLGEGVSRMLGIAIALVSVKGGFLFIDDIDTGLHYSTMEKMWELVWETAKKLDVQVFATTHSDDCWRSLAAIAERDDAKIDGVSIQRIEKGKTKAVHFTGREIVIAAERLGEVR